MKAVGESLSGSELVRPLDIAARSFSNTMLVHLYNNEWALADRGFNCSRRLQREQPTRQKLFRNPSFDVNFCSRSRSIFIAFSGSVPASARRNVCVFGKTVVGRSFSSLRVPV